MYVWDNHSHIKVFSKLTNTKSFPPYIQTLKNAIGFAEKKCTENKLRKEMYKYIKRTQIFFLKYPKNKEESVNIGSFAFDNQHFAQRGTLRMQY